MPRAFISHATPDRGLVERALLNPLKERGVGIWYCKDDIGLGDDWLDKINEGLEKCDWFVLVLTPQAVASEYVQAELQTALNMAKNGEKEKNWVVPILLQTCQPTKLHIRLSTIQHLDFISDQKAGMRRLIAHFGVEFVVKTPRVETPPPVVVPAPEFVLSETHAGLRELLARLLLLLEEFDEMARYRDEVEQLLARLERGRPRLVLLGDYSRGKTTLLHVLTDDAGPTALATASLTGVPPVMWSSRLGFETIDSPFANDDGPAGTITANLLCDADLLLVVLSAHAGVASASERNLITRLNSQGVFAFLFVCNQMDLVRQRDRQRLRDYATLHFSNWTAFGSNGVLFTSAKDGLEGRARRDQARIEQSGILTLEAAVRRLGDKGGLHLKSWGVASRLQALLAAEICPAVETMLRTTPRSSVERRHPVEKCARQLQAIQAELRNHQSQLAPPSLAKPEYHP